MLSLLLAAAPALAFDLDLRVAPQEGTAAWVTFHDVVPGVEQSVNVACGTAPNCRLSVTVTPDGDQFRVAINVVEVRKRWLGGERTSLVGAPTFLVPQNEQAEFFVGGEVSIPGSEPVAFREVGLHIQARVSNRA